MSKTIEQLASEYEAARQTHANAQMTADYVRDLYEWAEIQRMKFRQEANEAERRLLNAAAGDAA